ncbi:uncharacterized protein DUF2851 [Christiangramia gaetbulicola]|uniref:Uncharacterized protein DUF2851 n=1 Tax=Christiangramia gaetbulicola TaxID=703340 RepID=A0A2T6AEL6_9FLAO|nr:DUF2851 family protein [Christiangramia gaetbulicola]PTX42260.1 uncharacterized protein DUF2851 [Christiangramia gaetbulicola]
MREDFLYHVWKFQKFNIEGIKTAENDVLDIIHPGFQNDLSGPDFFNSKIQIGDQLWAGNVEMHLKSSDWYFHNHETDPNYDNVILHVVWDHDAEIYRKDNSVIPTLVLKDRVEAGILEAYEILLEKSHLVLNCENDFKDFSDFQVNHWLERLYFERLESRSKLIMELLSSTGNNWEAVLFILLCRSFGSKVNADAFQKLAESFDFKIVQKFGANQFSLEALLLGQAGLIRETDQYSLDLKKEYDYLKHKFSLENEFLESPQFFRLRPDNFPTIRLAQLAAIYAKHKSLFQNIILEKNLAEFYKLFEIEVSEYWNRHYNFGKSHSVRKKKLTSNFIDLLLINCVIPLKHSYASYLGEEDEGVIQDLISEIKVEKNSVISIFNQLRPGTAKNAMDSQALLQLKTEYCNLNKCLQCELGASILRKSAKYI